MATQDPEEKMEVTEEDKEEVTEGKEEVTEEVTEVTEEATEEVTEDKEETKPPIVGTAPIIISEASQRTIFGVDKLRPDMSMYELLRDSDPEPELTEEEKAELQRKKDEMAEKRIEEKRLLHKLGYKLIDSDVSNVKIHFKIDMFDWKIAMTGPALMEYFDKLSQKEPKPSRYNPSKMDHPPKFNAKIIGGYLYRLGKWELSNEARWIEVITSMQEPDEIINVEHFFRNMVATLRLPENERLFNDLKVKTKSRPLYIGQILEDLALESFFKRDLIDYCATLDYMRMFQYRKLLQDNYLMAFHLKYSEDGFQTNLLKMAREYAQFEPPRARGRQS